MDVRSVLTSHPVIAHSRFMFSRRILPSKRKVSVYSPNSGLVVLSIPLSVFDNTQSGACVANEVGIHPGGMLAVQSD